MSGNSRPLKTTEIAENVNGMLEDVDIVLENEDNSEGAELVAGNQKYYLRTQKVCFNR
jgi:hypothetical protein